MNESKKHDGPYTVRERNGDMDVLHPDGTVLYSCCTHTFAEGYRDRLNLAYHTGRADLLKQLGAGDWLPKVGDQVQARGWSWPFEVDAVTIGVHDKFGHFWSLRSCKPYVRPLEVGDKVRTFDGVVGRLLAVCDDVGVIWDAEHKVSLDEPIGKLTRAE